MKQKAQIATFFKNFDEAERLYLELDCQNLAVDLRARLGDWFKVVKLLKIGGGAGGCGLVYTHTLRNLFLCLFLQLVMTLC